ncbi:uncharacterized protein [Aristolochia californica]|uniref:uncharacterized protein n=1 Tax=Aristolochia californica TaxID=171875 RepID=UPI0035DD1087
MEYSHELEFSLPRKALSNVPLSFVCEALTVAICLTNIKSYLEVAKTQLLSSSTLPSFDDISTTLLWIPDLSPSSLIDTPSAMFSDNRGTSSPFRGCGRNTRGGHNSHSCIEPRLCTYCCDQNHLVDSCWKLHGKSDWATSNPASVNVDKMEDMTDSHSENVTISSEDYAAIQKLKSLLDQSSTPPSPTVATTISSCMLSSTSSPSSWIIDFGASEHSQVLGKGFSSLTVSIPLQYSPSSCIFQDLSTKQVIGGSHEKRGSYYFTLPPVAATSITTSEAQLWHNQLGHPSTSSFCSLVPSLKSLSNFNCEACQLSKHVNIFSSSYYY